MIDINYLEENIKSVEQKAQQYTAYAQQCFGAIAVMREQIAFLNKGDQENGETDGREKECLTEI